MNALSAHMLSWLLWTSVHVVLLVGLVLAVDRTTRRFLSPGWRHALWILALVPLVCPILPASRWSPLSLLHMTAGRTAAEPRPLTRDALVRSADSTDGRARVGSPAPQLAAPEAGEAAAFQILPTVLVSLWAVGALALLLRQWHVARGFWRRVSGGQAVVDPAVLNELAECRQTLGLRRAARLMETDAVGSPALAGIVRPTVLLPVGLLGELSADERQCLFLHELAHVKRWDLALDALAGLCQVLYWFNPVVHFVAARLRAVRELACDAHVLEAQRGGEALYAQTLLKLASQASGFRALPALAGMAERASSLETRLRSIRLLRPARWRHAWGLCTLALVAVVGLTRAGDPQTPTAEPVAAPMPIQPETAASFTKRQTAPQVTLDSQFIEVCADTPEALKALLDKLVPVGVKRLGIDGDGVERAGIVSSADRDEMQGALKRLYYSDVLSSPKVTTLPGHTAIIRMVEERYLPTGWSRLDENGKPNSKKDRDGNPLPIPIFGDSTDIGCILEVTPQLLADYTSVDLETTARVVEMAGWEDTKVKDARDPSTEFTVPKEVLRTRLASAQLAIPIGSSACLVTNFVPGETTWEDRVPILGDLPLVGRMFRSAAKTTYAKGLVVLITPSLVQADVTPSRPRQEPKSSPPITREPTGIDWGE